MNFASPPLGSGELAKDVETSSSLLVSLPLCEGMKVLASPPTVGDCEARCSVF